MIKKEDRIKLFNKYMAGTRIKLCEIKLEEKGFFDAPASTKYHGNYAGGLFDHSFAVMKFLLELTERNQIHWEREDSPKIIGMFHDLCKVDQYEAAGEEYRYQEETLLKGHGEKSIMLLSEYTMLTEEEILCIRYHMGAFTDPEEWKDYTRAVSRYQTVLWTHTADMLASHGLGI